MRPIRLPFARPPALTPRHRARSRRAKSPDLRRIGGRAEHFFNRVRTDIDAVRNRLIEQGDSASRILPRAPFGDQMQRLFRQMRHFRH